MYKPYWDISSLLLYLLMAFIGVICFSYANKTFKTGHKRRGVLSNPYYLIIILTWSLLAAFRLVDDGIGGSDAIEYIYFFKNCWGSYDLMMEHTASDLLFKWINQVLRLLTNDYHVYFFIIYGLVTYGYVKFVHHFTSSISNPIPLLMVFYLYLRGFNTLRTNLCISFILIGLTCLANKKVACAYLLMICSFLTHKSGFLFGLAIPFVHIIERKKIKKKYIICAAGVVFFLAAGIRDYFIAFASINDLGGAYSAYASVAKENNTILSGVVECFMQYVLAVTIILFSNKIIEVSQQYNNTIKNNISMLLNMCYFDAILIPLNIMMGIWRGYEFFMIPRICMWTYILFFLLKIFPGNSRVYLKTAYLLVVLSWFIFRLNRTYLASNLMPYIFSFS